MTLSSSGGTSATQTDGSGNYAFNNVAGGANYTLTPSKSGLSFNPANRVFNNLNANQSGINFARSRQSARLRPSGMVAWYPGDGNANDIQGSNNGTLQNGTTFGQGMVGQAFTFDGANDRVITALDVQPSAMQSTTWDARVFRTRVGHNLRQTIFSDDDGGFDRTVVIEAGTQTSASFTGRGVSQPVGVTLNQRSTLPWSIRRQASSSIRTEFASHLEKPHPARGLLTGLLSEAIPASRIVLPGAR